MFRVRNADTGWICAAVVLAAFMLQTLIPSRLGGLGLAASDTLPTSLFHSASSMLLHGGWLHAGINAASFICLMRGVKVSSGFAALLFGFLGGYLAAFVFHAVWMPENAVLIGSSGLVFGLLGWWTAAQPFSRWGILGLGSIPLVILSPVLVLVDAVTSQLFFSHNAWPVHSLAYVISGTITLILCTQFRGTWVARAV